MTETSTSKKYSIIKQNRYRILICEGFRYSRYMVVYNKEYWRCTDRSCRGKLHLSGSRIVYIKKNGHSHGPDHKGISADQALFVIRKRVYNEETSMKQIYSETMKEFEESGHGPMKDLLPYATVMWTVLNRGQGTSGELLVDSSGNCDVELPDDGNSINVLNGDGDGVSACIANDQKSEVSEVEFIDCTTVMTESPLSSPTSSSVTIVTRPLSKMIPASHASLSKSSRVPYNTASAYSDKRSPAATITTQGGLQQGSDAPGLMIHSAYSLQTTPIQANANANLQDHSPGIVGNHDITRHSKDSLLATTQHGGHQTTSQTMVTYTMPSTSSDLLVNSNSSHALGSSRTDTHLTVPQHSSTLDPTTSNHFSGPKRSVLKNAGSRITSVRMPSRLALHTRPNTMQSVDEPVTQPRQNSSSRGQVYTELQTRLTRKEHRLRLQYMKERHNADMVLVHLQQELVREQLRELRQPRGSVST